MTSFEETLQVQLKISFPHSGIVSYDKTKKEYLEQFNLYQNWIDHGYFGNMDYLNRGSKRRQNPEELFPEIKSVLVVAIPYSPWPKKQTDPLEVEYSSYLNGADYHDSVFKKLNTFLLELKKDHPHLKWKTCVDTSAVLERTWGYLAGLGWIGKNTMLIHPQWGSYFFIGVAFLNAEITKEVTPLKNYCGHCSLCLQSCPTSAFVSDSVLDARKCISYLTLENRESFLENEAKALGTKIAGCDICQQVCPFNHKKIKNSPLLEDKVVGAIELKQILLLLKETEQEYRLRVKGSSLSRIKPHQFQRNLAAVLLNILESESFSINILNQIKDHLSVKVKLETEDKIKTLWLKCINIIDSQRI